MLDVFSLFNVMYESIDSLFEGSMHYKENSGGKLKLTIMFSFVDLSGGKLPMQ